MMKLGKPTKNQIKIYCEEQTKTGLIEGDVVKVVRKAETYEKCWNNSWEPEMDASIGKKYSILEITEDGIELFDVGICEGIYFPYFVLEKVDGK